MWHKAYDQLLKLWITADVWLFHKATDLEDYLARARRTRFL